MSLVEMQQFPLCYHPSSANRELSQLRSDPITAHLKEALTGVTLGSYLFQICGHDHDLHRSHKKKANPKFSHADLNNCKAVTAFIVAEPHGTDASVDTQHAVIAATAFGVPAIVVNHEPYDTQNRFITLTNIIAGQELVIPNTHWSHFIRLTRTLQSSHEHLLHRCTVSLSEPTIPPSFLVAPRAAPATEDDLSDYADLTVSAVARTVAGVRHLDIDISIACDECNTLLALIETSEKKNIAVTQTINLANQLDVPAYRIRYSKNASGNMSNKVTLYEYENSAVTPGTRNSHTWCTNPASPQKPRLDDISVEQLTATLQQLIDNHRATHENAVSDSKAA